MKRFSDVMLALVLFAPCLALIFILCLLIICIDRFFPFYTQSRIGRNGKKFQCYKLQTMRPTLNGSDIANKERDKKRATKLGNFIRNHGWDEIPQLINILRGDMSFVGPRPLCENTLKNVHANNPAYKKEINDWMNARILVRPGLSGLHQTHCERDEDIIPYDHAHVSGIPLFSIVKIFLITFKIFVFGKHGPAP